MRLSFPFMWLLAQVGGPLPQDAVQQLMAVERGAARYVQSKYPRRRIGMEPMAQEFGTPHPPTGPCLARHRTASDLEELARLGGGVLVRGNRPPWCGAGPARECVDLIFRIGLPEFIAGRDSARIWLYTFEVIEGGKAREEWDVQLLFIRSSAGWQFGGEGQIRTAYFAKP